MGAAEDAEDPMSEEQTGPGLGGDVAGGPPTEQQLPAELLPPRSGSWRRDCGPGGSDICFASGGRRNSLHPRAILTGDFRSLIGRTWGRLRVSPLSNRRFMITSLLVLHALAALAGLVVRGFSVAGGRASARGTLRATVDGLALAVAASS